LRGEAVGEGGIRVWSAAGSLGAKVRSTARGSVKAVGGRRGRLGDRPPLCSATSGSPEEAGAGNEATSATARSRA